MISLEEKNWNCHMFVSSDLRLCPHPPRMAAKCAHQGFQPDLTPLLLHGGVESVFGAARRLPGVSRPSRRLRMDRAWQGKPRWQVRALPTGRALQTAVRVSHVLTSLPRAFCMSRSCLWTRVMQTKGAPHMTLKRAMNPLDGTHLF